MSEVHAFIAHADALGEMLSGDRCGGPGASIPDETWDQIWDLAE